MYYKANAKVAEELKVTSLRRRLEDGNYILWFADMLELSKRLGVWGETTITSMVGALPLTPVQAKEEQDGKNLRILPTPTDERYIMPGTVSEEPTADEVVDADSEAPAEESDAAPEPTPADEPAEVTNT